MNRAYQLRECGYVPVSLKNTRLTKPAAANDQCQEPLTVREAAEEFAEQMDGTLGYGESDPIRSHRRAPSLFSVIWEPVSEQGEAGAGEAQAVLIKCQACGRKYLEVGWVESGWLAQCPYCGDEFEM